MTTPINAPDLPAGNQSVAPKSPVTAGASPPLDFDALLDRCGGNSRFAAAIIAQFRQSAAEEVEKIAAALSRADAGAVRRAAHTSKSMAACASADAAAELARKIEDFGRANRLQTVPQLLDELRAQVNDTIAWIDHRGIGAGASTGHD